MFEFTCNRSPPNFCQIFWGEIGSGLVGFVRVSFGHGSGLSLPGQNQALIELMLNLPELHSYLYMMTEGIIYFLDM